MTATDPGVVSEGRGEYVLTGNSSEYPVAYTIGAFEEFERVTGKMPVTMVANIAQAAETHDFDLDNLTPAEAIALVAALDVGTADVKQMVRCGLIGYAAHGNARGAPKLGDARLSQIITDCGGTIALFTQVLSIWMRSKLLFGELAGLDGNDDGEELDEPDPTTAPGGAG